ncbi:MAG: hypothetical protein ACP5MH_03105 [Thermoproteus sp.]
MPGAEHLGTGGTSALPHGTIQNISSVGPSSQEVAELFTAADEDVVVSREVVDTGVAVVVVVVDLDVALCVVDSGNLLELEEAGGGGARVCRNSTIDITTRIRTAISNARAGPLDMHQP